MEKESKIKRLEKFYGGKDIGMSDPKEIARYLDEQGMSYMKGFVLGKKTKAKYIILKNLIQDTMKKFLTSLAIAVPFMTALHFIILYYAKTFNEIVARGEFLAGAILLFIIGTIIICLSYIVMKLLIIFKKICDE